MLNCVVRCTAVKGKLNWIHCTVGNEYLVINGILIDDYSCGLEQYSCFEHLEADLSDTYKFKIVNNPKILVTRKIDWCMRKGIGGGIITKGAGVVDHLKIHPNAIDYICYTVYINGVRIGNYECSYDDTIIYLGVAYPFNNVFGGSISIRGSFADMRWFIEKELKKVCGIKN